ncbi:hypothetical protein CARN8_6610013 [mine drainage metagenome]|uniref:Uncharacterized protein n=1 Tax=mine drainage metagenome TaxID=410659 RepID=A0A3P3ZS01_9ZZZZ
MGAHLFGAVFLDLDKNWPKRLEKMKLLGRFVVGTVCA